MAFSLPITLSFTCHHPDQGIYVCIYVYVPFPSDPLYGLPSGPLKNRRTALLIRCNLFMFSKQFVFHMRSCHSSTQGATRG